MAGTPRPVVHLELHTGDSEGATSFYGELLGWRAERIHAAGHSYTALELGGGFGGGGVVECEVHQPLWLPYVEVESVREVTEHARGLGAAVLLEPRDGPVGSRSVITTPAGGDVAFWEPKDR
jgi:predicted enzyme related to lactoylglutathione lyase